MTFRSPLLHVVIAFLLSTLLTAAFILRYGHYPSGGIMLLSGSVAGGKWAIQIVLGYLLLGPQRWLYLSQLGTTCAIGSFILLPYAIVGGGPSFFFGSLVAAVLVMALDFFIRIRRNQFPIRWYFLWLGLLAIAVTLQLTVVFR